jgi:16S rRNA (cytosine967-C5)-methyltransferase
MTSINTRAYASQVLIKILNEKCFLAESLLQTIPHNMPSSDRAFIHELCYGVSRWYFQLDALLKQLLSKPLKEKDQDIQLLLMMGIYQLLYMRVPDYAAVSETVNTVNNLRKPWAKALVNGVLRQFLREREKLLLSIQNDPSSLYAHPRWFVKKCQQAWPEQWQAILNANNQRPPLSLRVNIQKNSAEQYLETLKKHGIEASLTPYASSGIKLEQGLEVESLPDFSKGVVSVQDFAAQLAAKLLNPNPGERILDACAAPGGKTSHLLEIAPQLKEVIAIDHEVGRVAKIKDNLKRLGLIATLLVADATDPDSFWDGQLFDGILLDAPCSATGVIRRHPDIKLLRQPDDITVLTKQQSLMLEKLWPLLKPGGRLLYVTCSILPDENSEIIKSFLANHKETAQLSNIRESIPSIGVDTGFGLQIFPGESDPSHSDMDGFFYARLEKIS